MTKPAPKYYVATFGDLGLVVEFFTNKREYERECTSVEKEHAAGKLDTYTYGDVA